MFSCIKRKVWKIRKSLIRSKVFCVPTNVSVTKKFIELEQFQSFARKSFVRRQILRRENFSQFVSLFRNLIFSNETFEKDLWVGRGSLRGKDLISSKKLLCAWERVFFVEIIRLSEEVFKLSRRSPQQTFFQICQEVFDSSTKVSNFSAEDFNSPTKFATTKSESFEFIESLRRQTLGIFLRYESSRWEKFEIT